MKNPMDRQLEKRLSDRAVAIGREGNVEAFGELLELLQSSSANARRLAASALGKLAWLGADQAAAVAALAPVARRDPHTQTQNKTIEARDGTVVQSEGERRIADWLTARGLAYRYDSKFRIIGEFQIRPDFYLPELDVYIEYWGLDTPQYKMSMLKKQTLYQQEGKRLVSVYPADLPRLDSLLTTKLELFGYTVAANEQSEVSATSRGCTMNTSQPILVPPRSARAFTLCAGQTVRVEDTEGRQPGDLVAFRAGNPAVKLSQARTRVENRKVAVTRGDALWTNTFPPEVMLTIVEDAHGGHDLLYPPCCRYALDKRFGVARDGCLENLAAALAPWGLKPPDIPDPLNLFFQVSVDTAGRMTVREPASKPGSAISLKAHMDCFVAVSTCAVPFPGKTSSGYCITIRDAG